MSWGRGFSGTAASVKEQAAAFAASVRADDERYQASEETKSVHGTQCRTAAETVGAIVDSYPEGTVFSGSVSGSVTDGSSGSVNISYALSIPAKDAGEGAEAL
jgi:hypothetical protein